MKSTSEPTAEWIEKEINSELDKEFKNCRDIARGMKWQEEFPE